MVGKTDHRMALLQSRLSRVSKTVTNALPLLVIGSSSTFGVLHRVNTMHFCMPEFSVSSQCDTAKIIFNTWWQRGLVQVINVYAPLSLLHLGSTVEHLYSGHHWIQKNLSLLQRCHDFRGQFVWIWITVGAQKLSWLGEVSFKKGSTVLMFQPCFWGCCISLAVICHWR